MHIFFFVEIQCTTIMSSIDSLSLFILGTCAQDIHLDAIGIQSCSPFVGTHAEFKHMRITITHLDHDVELFFAGQYHITRISPYSSLFPQNLMTFSRKNGIPDKTSSRLTCIATKCPISTCL
jgi:hypothetical protein